MLANNLSSVFAEETQTRIQGMLPSLAALTLSIDAKSGKRKREQPLTDEQEKFVEEVVESGEKMCDKLREFCKTNSGPRIEELYEAACLKFGIDQEKAKRLVGTEQWNKLSKSSSQWCACFEKICAILGYGYGTCVELRKLYNTNTTKDLCTEQICKAACRRSGYDTDTERDNFLATRKLSGSKKPWRHCFLQHCFVEEVRYEDQWRKDHDKTKHAVGIPCEDGVEWDRDRAQWRKNGVQIGDEDGATWDEDWARWETNIKLSDNETVTLYSYTPYERDVALQFYKSSCGVKTTELEDLAESRKTRTIEKMSSQETVNADPEAGAKWDPKKAMWTTNIQLFDNETVTLYSYNPDDRKVASQLYWLNKYRGDLGVQTLCEEIKAMSDKRLGVPKKTKVTTFNWPNKVGIGSINDAEFKEAEDLLQISKYVNPASNDAARIRRHKLFRKAISTYSPSDFERNLLEETVKVVNETSTNPKVEACVLYTQANADAIFRSVNMDKGQYLSIQYKSCREATAREPGGTPTYAFGHVNKSYRGMMIVLESQADGAIFLTDYAKLADTEVPETLQIAESGPNRKRKTEQYKLEDLGDRSNKPPALPARVALAHRLAQECEAFVNATDKQSYKLTSKTKLEAEEDLCESAKKEIIGFKKWIYCKYGPEIFKPKDPLPDKLKDVCTKLIMTEKIVAVWPKEQQGRTDLEIYEWGKWEDADKTKVQVKTATPNKNGSLEIKLNTSHGKNHAGVAETLNKYVWEDNHLYVAVQQHQHQDWWNDDLKNYFNWWEFGRRDLWKHNCIIRWGGRYDETLHLKQSFDAYMKGNEHQNDASNADTWTAKHHYRHPMGEIPYDVYN